MTFSLKVLTQTMQKTRAKLLVFCITVRSLRDHICASISGDSTDRARSSLLMSPGHCCDCLPDMSCCRLEKRTLHFGNFSHFPQRTQRPQYHRPVCAILIPAGCSEKSPNDTAIAFPLIVPRKSRKHTPIIVPKRSFFGSIFRQSKIVGRLHSYLY
jgi:hypothetical protein